MSALRELVLGRPGRMLAAGALAAAMALAGIGLLATSGALIARAAQHPETVLALLVLITGVRFFGLARAGVRYAERVVAHDLTLRRLADLRGRVYRRLHPRAPLDLGSSRSADLLGGLLEDIDELQALPLRVASPLIAAVLVAAASVALAAWAAPASAAVLLGLMLLAGGALPAVLVALERRVAAREAGLRRRQRRLLLDAVQGAGELWVFGRVADHAARLEAVDARLAAVSRGRAALQGVRDGAGAAFALVAPAAVLAAASPSVLSGARPPLVLVPLALGAMGAFEVLPPLAEAMARWSPVRAAAARTEATLRAEPRVRDPERPRTAPAGGAFRLEGVHLRLRGRPALAGVDLELTAGRRVAVVGPSGAGKSTALALMVRFADPDRGRVTLAGVDLRDLAQEAVRERCTVVPQRVRVFHGSVRGNLRLASPDADDARLWDALERAELAAVVAALPQGLDTPLGDGGRALSGGERQRLALARAFLQDAPWWLLDEPTAHLDATLERRVLARLLAPHAGRGVLWLTHRLVGMERLDEIVVLDGGRVVERGTHAELAREGDVYRRLLAAQGLR